MSFASLISYVKLEPITEGKEFCVEPCAPSQVFGRGPILGIDSKQLSRKHFHIQIVQDVKITALGLNALTVVNKKKQIKLEKDESTWLSDGDTVFLCVDQFPYRVSIFRNGERPFLDGGKTTITPQKSRELIVSDDLPPELPKPELFAASSIPETTSNENNPPKRIFATPPNEKTKGLFRPQLSSDSNHELFGDSADSQQKEVLELRLSKESQQKESQRNKNSPSTPDKSLPLSQKPTLPLHSPGPRETLSFKIDTPFEEDLLKTPAKPHHRVGDESHDTPESSLEETPLTFKEKAKSIQWMFDTPSKPDLSLLSRSEDEGGDDHSNAGLHAFHRSSSAENATSLRFASHSHIQPEKVPQTELDLQDDDEEEPLSRSASNAFASFIKNRTLSRKTKKAKVEHEDPHSETTQQSKRTSSFFDDEDQEFLEKLKRDPSLTLSFQQKASKLEEATPIATPPTEELSLESLNQENVISPPVSVQTANSPSPSEVTKISKLQNVSKSEKKTLDENHQDHDHPLPFEKTISFDIVPERPSNIDLETSQNKDQVLVETKQKKKVIHRKPKKRDSPTEIPSQPSLGEDEEFAKQLQKELEAEDRRQRMKQLEQDEELAKKLANQINQNQTNSNTSSHRQNNIKNGGSKNRGSHTAKKAPQTHQRRLSMQYQFPFVAGQHPRYCTKKTVNYKHLNDEYFGNSGSSSSEYSFSSEDDDSDEPSSFESSYGSSSDY